MSDAHAVQEGVFSSSEVLSAPLPSGLMLVMWALGRSLRPVSRVSGRRPSSEKYRSMSGLPSGIRTMLSVLVRDHNRRLHGGGKVGPASPRRYGLAVRVAGRAPETIVNALDQRVGNSVLEDLGRPRRCDVVPVETGASRPASHQRGRLGHLPGRRQLVGVEQGRIHTGCTDFQGAGFGISDCSLALLREGYIFISARCDRVSADLCLICRETESAELPDTATRSCRSWK